MGKYDQFWQMKYKNPVAPGGEEEVYKCTKCNAETFHQKGWDGSPDTHKCSRDCRMDHSSVQGGSRAFKENLAKIFPDSPGSDI